MLESCAKCALSFSHPSRRSGFICWLGAALGGLHIAVRLLQQPAFVYPGWCSPDWKLLEKGSFGAASKQCQTLQRHIVKRQLLLRGSDCSYSVHYLWGLGVEQGGYDVTAAPQNPTAGGGAEPHMRVSAVVMSQHVSAVVMSQQKRPTGGSLLFWFVVRIWAVSLDTSSGRTERHAMPTAGPTQRMQCASVVHTCYEGSADVVFGEWLRRKDGFPLVTSQDNLCCEQLSSCDVVCVLCPGAIWPDSKQ